MRVFYFKYFIVRITALENELTWSFIFLNISKEDNIHLTCKKDVEFLLKKAKMR